mmetsp:Transcript_38189/g.59603  ORF Transcript_38189/g.59603 Transcript_38189/m.59603 type:complete len:571 (+) Transcript_38189:75-1787(+)|eukprot:CAMPEP_0184300062 /NCGR_PEP_ID=MMETSP1049-20130417/10557_1 /TAXON_ID=77928 /ORGANISM="Proteomonas sulcata, Strain CCMP704" /LENGTH=570 /DNA_ID=CAMNT_0026610689 /DNA_START=69 /DNA_END=1781 /DNA_ORIENTATION=+
MSDSEFVVHCLEEADGAEFESSVPHPLGSDGEADLLAARGFALPKKNQPSAQSKPRKRSKKVKQKQPAPKVKGKGGRPARTSEKGKKITKADQKVAGKKRQRKVAAIESKKAKTSQSTKPAVMQNLPAGVLTTGLEIKEVAHLQTTEQESAEDAAAFEEMGELGDDPNPSHLLLELADRIPFSAVWQHEKTVWRKFKKAAEISKSGSQVTQLLGWLILQVRPEATTAAWRKSREGPFSEACRSCTSLKEARLLIKTYGKEALNWRLLAHMFAQERGEMPSDRSGPVQPDDDPHEVNQEYNRTCEAFLEDEVIAGLASLKKKHKITDPGASWINRAVVRHLTARCAQIPYWSTGPQGGGRGSNADSPSPSLQKGTSAGSSPAPQVSSSSMLQASPLPPEPQAKVGGLPGSEALHGQALGPTGAQPGSGGPNVLGVPQMEWGNEGLRNTNQIPLAHGMMPGLSAGLMNGQDEQSSAPHLTGGLRGSSDSLIPRNSGLGEGGSSPRSPSTSFVDPPPFMNDEDYVGNENFPVGPASHWSTGGEGDDVVGDVGDDGGWNETADVDHVMDPELAV